jgi:hypothetical protein
MSRKLSAADFDGQVSGGGGGSRILAAARVDCTDPLNPVLVDGTNVASIARTATGMYHVTFENAIDPSIAGFNGGGAWANGFSSSALLWVGIERADGRGLDATGVDISTASSSPAGQLFDADGWFSFELYDVTQQEGSGGGNPSRVLLGHVTTTDGQLSVSFADIPDGYDHLEIVADHASVLNNGGIVHPLGLRFNGDSGNNYRHTMLGTYGNGTGFGNQAVDSSSMGLGFNSAGGTAGVPFASSKITIPGYRSSRTKNAFCAGSGWQGNVGLLQGTGAGYWTGTDPIGSIDIVDRNGDAFLEGSEFWLYGIRGGEGGGGGGGSTPTLTLTPPVAADFPMAINQDTLTLIDREHALIVDQPGALGFEARGFFQDAPAAPWTVYAKLDLSLVEHGNNCRIGIGVRNATSEKLTCFGVYTGASGSRAVGLTQWNNPTSYNGDSPAATYGVVDPWLKLENDGTNLNLYWGDERGEWMLVRTVTLAAFMVSVDEVGIIMQANNISKLSVLSWGFEDPAGA